jgi:transcriptional regulator with XRE-family HTH domain
MEALKTHMAPIRASRKYMANEKGSETLAFNLRLIMKQKGFSIRSLAEAASLSPSVVQDILKQNKSPRLESVEQIAKALEVSVSKLFLPGAEYDAGVESLVEFYNDCSERGKGRVIRFAANESQNPD